jgi:hypothetical protein
MSFDIFVALWINVCSSLVPTHFSSTFTLMPTWGSDPSDFKSLSAYCVFLGSSLIGWKTKKQIVVSRSNVEAELHALACVIAEVT